MATSRNIEYRPLSELAADPKNPKAHDLETLGSSVERFGFIEPITIDERTGYIVSGHGRTTTLRAMQERGETPPEGIRLSDDGEWLAPVVVGWASRTDAEASAALIALNRTTELGGWVDDSLLSLLEELSEDEGGFEGVGFSEYSLDALRSAVDREKNYLEEDDDEELSDEEIQDRLDDIEDRGKIVVKIEFPSYEELSEFRDLPGQSDWDRVKYLMGREG